MIRDRRLLIIGVACGILCAVFVLIYMLQIQSEAQAARADALARYGGEQIEVCVASRDIAAGEIVDSGSIETKLWIADLLPFESVQSPHDIIGKQTTSSILSGEVISFLRFKKNDLSLDVPDGYSAVSLPAKDVSAVGGAISAGMLVNVYSVSSSGALLIGRSLLVLATNASSEKSDETSISWITLAVLPQNVQELIAAAEKSDLYFTIPSSSESESLTESDSTVPSDSGIIESKQNSIQEKNLNQNQQLSQQQHFNQEPSAN